MLETKNLDDLSRLLEEMTHPKLASKLRIMQGAQKYSLLCIVIIVSAFLALAVARQRLESPTPELDYYLSALGNVFVVSFVVFIVTIIVTLVYITWNRKPLALYISPPSLENTLRRDAELITQLLTFDKATLVYGLLQYRFRWLSFQDRSAALIGDFRKLGIFPALVALVISAPEFLKDSNPLLWSLLALVAILYIVAFDAALSRQRSQQVIQLLEYAIQHADQGNTIPSDTNH